MQGSTMVDVQFEGLKRSIHRVYDAEGLGDAEYHDAVNTTAEFLQFLRDNSNNFQTADFKRFRYGVVIAINMLIDTVNQFEQNNWVVSTVSELESFNQEIRRIGFYERLSDI